MQCRRKKETRCFKHNAGCTMQAVTTNVYQVETNHCWRLKRAKFISSLSSSRSPTNHKLTVTVMLLLSTISVGGSSLHRTSMSDRYRIVSPSSRLVPSEGIGNVVINTAVSAEFCLISSLRIKCCARLGRSLKEREKLCVEYVDPASCSSLISGPPLYEPSSSGMERLTSPWPE